MNKTSDSLRSVFEQVCVQVDSRDPIYGDCWKTEDINFLLTQVGKKSRGISYMAENGNMYNAKFLEEILDLCGYAGLLYKRVENEVK